MGAVQEQTPVVSRVAPTGGTPEGEEPGACFDIREIIDDLQLHGHMIVVLADQAADQWLNDLTGGPPGEELVFAFGDFYRYRAELVGGLLDKVVSHIWVIECPDWWQVWVNRTKGACFAIHAALTAWEAKEDRSIDDTKNLFLALAAQGDNLRSAADAGLKLLPVQKAKDRADA